MNCVACRYPLRLGDIFCPVCGKSQVEIRIEPPEQAFAGVRFDCQITVLGNVSLTLEQVQFSGTDLGVNPRVLAPSETLQLQINGFSGICDKTLKFRFQNYPEISKIIELVNAAGLEFEVQNLYRIKPFAKTPGNILNISFSVYEEFSLRLQTTEPWALASSYHIAHNKKSIPAERRDNKLIWRSEALFGLLGEKTGWKDTKFDCQLGIITQDGQRIWAPVEIEFNHVPKFDLLNEQEIIANNRFLLDNPAAPMKEIIALIGISNVANAKFETKSTDFKNFRVKADEPYIRVDTKPRYQTDDDCRVRIKAIPSEITGAVFSAIKAKRQFEFHISLDIEPLESFDTKLCRSFKLAIPAETGVKMSDFAVIDFGTTNSCMLDDDGKLTPSAMGGNEHNTLIHFIKFSDPPTESECTFNIDLTEKSGLNVASNFKSMLIHKAEQVYTYKDNYGEFKALTPIDLTHIYLKHLTNRLVQVSGKKPKEIVLTYPAIFSKQNRADLFDSVRRLGYQVIEENCVSEPEAIAFYYLSKHRTIRAKALSDRKATIAVLDCGGGTTDYSVVEYNNTDGQAEINVIASWGSNQFAGTYLTFAYAKCGSDGDNYPEEFSEVYDQSQEAKNYRERFNYLEMEKINFANEIDLSAGGDNVEKLLKKRNPEPGKYASVFLTNLKGNMDNKVNVRTIEDQFLQIQDVLKLLYDDGELESPSVDYLVLAGNSCRMALFKFFAEKHFPGIVIYDPNTIKTAVAQGAYIFRSSADGVVFQGLKRSKESFVMAGHLGVDKQVFKQWLNMGGDNRFESGWYPGTHKRNIVFFRVRSEAKDRLSQKSKAFELKLPDVAFARIKFELNYRDFRIIQRWIMEDQEGHTRETDWQTVYNHE